MVDILEPASFGSLPITSATPKPRPGYVITNTIQSTACWLPQAKGLTATLVTRDEVLGEYGVDSLPA